MELTKEAIEKRIAELTRERDAYRTQAGEQLAAYGGAIQALTQLIVPPEPGPVKKETT